MKMSFLKTLTGILFIFSNTSNAQEVATKHNSFALSPLGFVAGSYNSARIRFQHSIKYRFAFGTDLKYYFSRQYPGYQVSPFVKCLQQEKMLKGFICMARLCMEKIKDCRMINPYTMNVMVLAEEPDTRLYLEKISTGNST